MPKKMLTADFNYEIYVKELLAIVNTFKSWTDELWSVEASTLILNDHKNLEYLTSTKLLNRRQASWSELRANYDIRIMFRSEKSSGKPGSLIRIISDKPSTSENERKLPEISNFP